MKNPTPSSERELLQRAFEIAGKTLGELASQWDQTLPDSLLRAKGWVGQFIEKILGANAANLDQPDFVHLGIELKTIPMTPRGIPCESTYICTVSLPLIETSWEQSRVWRKMAKILWVPIGAAKNLPLSEQRVGSPLLWSPDHHIAQQLKQDWEELSELMALGHFSSLTAHQGKYLQIRPKAANAKTFTQAINHDGQLISIIPKGFYLRRGFTWQIMQQYYAW